MRRFAGDVVEMDRDLPGAAWWRIVAKARLRCEDPDCGIKGENPNIRFGKWVPKTLGNKPANRCVMPAASGRSLASDTSSLHRPCAITPRVVPWFLGRGNRGGTK